MTTVIVHWDHKRKENTKKDLGRKEGKKGGAQKQTYAMLQGKPKR